MSEQTRIPDVPPVGHLLKLRAVLGLSNSIIRQAKDADVGEPFARAAAAKAVAQTRRAIDKRMDSLGIPHKAVRDWEDFPSGTGEAARAAGEFWVALESAMSVIAAVNEAEQAAIPRGR